MYAELGTRGPLLPLAQGGDEADVSVRSGPLLAPGQAQQGHFEAGPGPARDGATDAVLAVVRMSHHHQHALDVGIGAWVGQEEILGAFSRWPLTVHQSPRRGVRASEVAVDRPSPIKAGTKFAGQNSPR